MPAGTLPCPAIGASVSEEGFAQLLSLLTGVPADTASLARTPTHPIQEDINEQHPTSEAMETHPTHLFASELMPLIPISIPTSPPALLGGGSQPAPGSRDTLRALPAPLPQIHEFSESSVSLLERNLDLSQKVELYSIYADKIQKNAINLYTIDSDELQDVPVKPVGAQQTDSTPAGNLPIQENSDNHITSHLFGEPFAPSNRTESREPIHEEVAILRVEPRTGADAHHSSRMAADHSLPFPAPYLTHTHFAHPVQPSDFVMPYDGHLHEQVAQAVERLVAHREEQTVHLRLEPPELGTLEIRIHLEGSAVHAWLTAERDLTRQALEQQAQQLREQLASRGLQLAHFEVNAGSQGAYERAQPTPPPPLPFAEPAPRLQQATDSLHLFGQWSAWA